VQVAVPSVITFTEEEAVDAITRVGLVPEVEQRADDTTAGEVIEQNPGPNTMVDEGSTVDIVVSSGPDAVEIPDVEGFSESAARTRLEAEGLTVADEVEEVEDPEYDEGTVVRTDPEAGQEVDPDEEEVVLVVASGQVEVPNVVGQDLGDAVSDLRDARLSPVTEFRDSAESEPNTVLEQSVSSGDVVDYGTEITLVVAREAPSTITETQTATVTVTPEPTETEPEPEPEPTDSPTDPGDGDNNGGGNGNGNGNGDGNDNGDAAGDEPPEEGQSPPAPTGSSGPTPGSLGSGAGVSP
jgi:beta-lactam-binding protein with PASTA domain